MAQGWRGRRATALVMALACLAAAAAPHSAATVEFPIEVRSECAHPIQLRLAHSFTATAAQCTAGGAQPYYCGVGAGADCTCVVPWRELAPGATVNLTGVRDENSNDNGAYAFTAHIVRPGGGNYSLSGRNPTGANLASVVDPLRAAAPVPDNGTRFWWAQVCSVGVSHADCSVTGSSLLLRPPLRACWPAHPHTPTDRRRSLTRRFVAVAPSLWCCAALATTRPPRRPTQSPQ